MAATDVVSSLQREVELAKEGLKSVDENIKKLTGRDPSEARGPVGNRRIVVKRNFGERIGGPPQKRFNTGNAYNRLGPRVNDRNNRRFGQLESDGEEEEDDGKKPTLQSSIVATPAPSRQQQDAKTDKKTQTRNKRMFGVLLGTLQKFKENSNKEAARERRRKQIDKKLEEAAVKEREEAIRQKKELFFARREQQTKLQELERKMEVAEMLEEWEDHDRKLSKFIRTNTKPHIFYLPAKHNDYTLGLLEKTAEHVEDAIKKRRQEIEEVLRKPGREDRDDAHDDYEEEPGHESMAHEEPDIKQEVERSDDEGNTRKKGVKRGRREVILTSVGRDKSRKNEDEFGEDKEEVELPDEKVRSEERERNVEVSERNEGRMKSEEKEVEEQVETKEETEKLPEEKEREGDVDMSEVNEVEEESEEKQVEEKDDTKVEKEKMSEEKEQGTKEEEVTGDIGVNRDPEGEPTKDGDGSELPATTALEDTAPPSSGEKITDVSVEVVDTQKSQNNPEDDEKQDERASKVHVVPKQDNLE